MNNPFRQGIQAAVQIIVDDLSGLVVRRTRINANGEITGAIHSIARRVVATPMPHQPDDAPLDRSSVLLDVATVTEEQVLAAAAALRDAEADIIQMEIDALPPDQQASMTIILAQHTPPPWSAMDSIRRQSYMYRARCMVAALVVNSQTADTRDIEAGAYTAGYNDGWDDGRDPDSTDPRVESSARAEGCQDYLSSPHYPGATMS